MKRGLFGLLALVLIVLVPAMFPVTFMGWRVGAVPAVAAEADERTDGTYFTIVDSHGRVIDQTARVVYPGDELITAENYHYRVVKVAGDTAYAELLGREPLEWSRPVAATGEEVVAVQGGQRNLIAVYHTHSDESYLPSDGRSSRPGDGGIYKVGEVFTERLRSLGVRVDYNKQPHEPHDADAYRRSRRTAFRLVQKGPAAIIDLHRDGIPDPDSYDAVVAGEPVARIRLVVGRQNQNLGANLDFAKRVKAYLDQHYPGLVRGIFLAHGNYNQDLSPHSLLVEVGTYTNSRERAQRGAALFAEALPRVLGIAVAPSPLAPGVMGAGADWLGVVWVLLALSGSIIGYLYLSTGSWEGVRERFREFFAREWGRLGRPRRWHFYWRLRERAAKPLPKDSPGAEAPRTEDSGTNQQRADYQKD
ncbi:MAG: stage II sporulation protein P [Moorellales bacterium]